VDRLHAGWEGAGREEGAASGAEGSRDQCGFGAGQHGCVQGPAFGSLSQFMISAFGYGTARERESCGYSNCSGQPSIAWPGDTIDLVALAPGETRSWWVVLCVAMQRIPRLESPLTQLSNNSIG